MSDVNELHNMAMDLAERALVQRMQGNEKCSLDLAEQALASELSAIQELKEPLEPTFSVLHRSAGTLALRCQKYRLAEQLASKALALEPPEVIAEELRDLIEQVNSQRHLNLRGIELGQDDVQMSLSGKEVGFGFVFSAELVSRIGDASRLIGRIAERRRNLQFAEKGLRGTTRKDFPVLVSVPRAASFAVTLKVGRQTGQPRLPVEIVGIVDEFMDLMELVHDSDMKTLEKRIPEPPYLRNFLGLAKKIAPDGDRVRQVGFTIQRGVQARRVSVTRPASDIQIHAALETATDDERAGKPVKVRGTLLFADATSDEANAIKIVNEEGRRRSVRVPEGMMNDIVRPMWNSKVVVKGLQKGQRIVLQDIEFDE